MKENVIMPNERNKSSEQRKYLLELQFLRNDTFIRRKRTLYAIISVFFGTYFTLVFYPGILYGDSIQRWFAVMQILAGVYNHDFSEIVSHLSITPVFFMALLYLFTFSFAAFTLVQAVFFFFSSFLMIDKFVRHSKPVVIVLFIFCPIFYAFSIYHEMSVGCVIGINFGLLLLLNEKLMYFKNWKITRKISYAVWLLACYYVAFGFRQNALTIFPVIVMVSIYLYQKYKDRLLLILQIGCVCFSMFFVSLFPSLLGINVLDGSSYGLAWEILSIIQKMPEEKQVQYSDYLDFIADGYTVSALAVNPAESSNVNVIWGPLGENSLPIPYNAVQIRRKYFNLAFTETSYFLKTKRYFIGGILGIREPLVDDEYPYNWHDAMNNFGMVDNYLRYLFVLSYHKFHEIIPLFRIPWIWFCIGLVFVVWQFIKTGKGYSFGSLALYLLSVFYYAAFLINTQSFEFRYFFPSFYYMFIVLADSVAMILYKLFSRLRKKETT